jgi:hypothetical protein
MQRLAIATLLGATCAKHQSKADHHNKSKGEHKKGDHHNKHHSSAVDAQMLEEIVGGVLKGAIAAEGFTDILSCIKDAEVVLGDAKIAVADF